MWAISLGLTQHAHCSLPAVGNSTGQMGTTSAWPTWMAATARCSSPTRRGPLVRMSHCPAGTPSALHRPPGPPQSLRVFLTPRLPCFPGLAIDYPESKLYWISSGNGTINRCNLDGSNLEVIESVKSQLSKATALAIMGESWQHDGVVHEALALSPGPARAQAACCHLQQLRRGCSSIKGWAQPPPSMPSHVNLRRVTALPC